MTVAAVLTLCIIVSFGLGIVAGLTLSSMQPGCRGRRNTEGGG